MENWPLLDCVPRSRERLSKVLPMAGSPRPTSVSALMRISILSLIALFSLLIILTILLCRLGGRLLTAPELLRTRRSLPPIIFRRARATVPSAITRIARDSRREQIIRSILFFDTVTFLTLPTFRLLTILRLTILTIPIATFRLPVKVVTVMGLLFRPE